MCLKELQCTSSTKSEMCFSGNQDTLKVTDPQGGTGTLQDITVKQKESLFYTCTFDWFCGKNSQPFMVNMTVYRAVF